MRFFLIVFCSLLFWGCSSTEIGKAHDLSVNKGTNTAVVKVLLDADGMPVVDTDPVVIEEGQRVVWVGPTDMAVRFGKKNPFGKEKLSTRDAVINVKVPKSKSWGKDEQYKTFKYDVLVGDQVLDPIFIVRRSF